MINLKYDLNDNTQLVNFFKHLFNNEIKNSELFSKAPEIMKFFIITRNYGLNNMQEYINRIYYNNDFTNTVVDAFINGFKKDNIEFNTKNLIEAIINNYHKNGFYFHSFPGIYANSINENGILANNRTKNDDTFYEIIKKYNFGKYFEKSQNRICLTEVLNNYSTHEYAIFTPEWLDIFLNTWHGDSHNIYERGDLDEIRKVIIESSQNIKNFMKKNPNYSESEFIFLLNYINNIANNRFKNGNSHVGIALIPRKKLKEFLGEKYEINYNEDLEKILNNKSPVQIVHFLTNILVKNEITINKNIPKNLLEILVYNIERQEEYHKQK